MIKRLERRITKIENAVECELDRSGFVAATQAQGEVWIKLSRIPEAVEIGRQSAELMLAGVGRTHPRCSSCSSSSKPFGWSVLAHYQHSDDGRNYLQRVCHGRAQTGS